MGWAAPSGRNVPSWLVDAAGLGELLERLSGALRRPPSFSGALQASLLVYDAQRIHDSVASVSEAARGTTLELRHALSEFRANSIDRAHQERLAALVNELAVLWSVRVTMALGLKRSAVLRRLLRSESPDILAVVRRENDENAHSDVLRWLLDPREAPALAPVALRSIVARFREPERWRTALRDGVALGCVSVRREVVIGYDMADDDNKDRIDLVVSGPGFVVAIENKVWASEHDEQTRSYARWLRSLRVPLRAGVFLTPNGMPAASSSFRSLSYLEHQSSEAFVWRVTLNPGSRYQRLDDVVWRQFRSLGAEFPLAHHDERGNTVRFVQRSLAPELSPETNFNDVKAILEFLMGADAALAEAVGVDVTPAEEAALG